MANNEAVRFRNFLKRTAVKWSRDMPDVGLRSVEIDGEFLREMYRQRKVTKFWKLLLTKLPADVVLIDTVPMPLQKVCDFTYADGHVLFFGSKEWEPTGKDTPIPNFPIVFERSDIETTRVR